MERRYQSESMVEVFLVHKERKMQSKTPRRFFNKVAMMAAAASGAPALLAQTPAQGKAGTEGGRGPGARIQDGIYYFPGIGANSGGGGGERVTVTDPFEKHATRAMDAL